MKIYLDDIRDPPSSDWVVVRTADEAIDLIKSGQVTEISFDHDLGEGKTGYDVALVIEQLAFMGTISPIYCCIHSANPVGAKNIMRAMESAWRYWNKRES